jgi:mannose-6-phosphate isomerase-like protein (cupin superfamily)
VHGRIEIFYILAGRLDHVVNGESHLLRPGMVGIVRPGDEVIHRVVSDVPVKALVIWAPGGEADRIAGFLNERPIEPN